MKNIPNVLNGFQLKLIALISMITDHICLVLFPAAPAAFFLRMTVGRIAMPVFAFLACEAFFYTKSRSSYCKRLLLFAIISEPCYDLAKHGVLFFPGDQNVFFSLLLGIILLCLIDTCYVKSNPYIMLLLTACFMAAAWLLHLDYDFCAVAMIAVFYIFHWYPKYTAPLISCSIVAVSYGTPGAYLATIVLLLYNRQSGPKKAVLKYLFYVIYPLHLVILHILSKIVF